MSTDIIVPRETANDDVVKVIRWLAVDGSDVTTGSPLLEIETSKSVIEISAPSSGRLAILSDIGSSVAVGAVAGKILDDSDASIANVRELACENLCAETTHSRISSKALSRMNELGIDSADVAHLPLVRVQDVEAIANARRTDPSPPPSAIKSRPEEDDSRKPKLRSGVDAVRQAASERGRSVIWLACNYVLRNWFLGNLARVAPVGVIQFIHRLRGVRMGKNCFIDPNAILETAYPENITLGDDVRVTAGAIIMTHIKAPYLLRDRGYVPFVSKPVVLNSHSFVGVNAVIMPGVTIGEGAVVTSGSVVTTDVASYTVVSGNPAKVVKTLR